MIRVGCVEDQWFDEVDRCYLVQAVKDFYELEDGKELEISEKLKGHVYLDGKRLVVHNVSITIETISDIFSNSMKDIEFSKCEFISCYFNDILVERVHFIDCRFEHCKFYCIGFDNCFIDDSAIDHSILFAAFFANSKIMDTWFNFCEFRDLPLVSPGEAIKEIETSHKFSEHLKKCGNVIFDNTKINRAMLRFSRILHGEISHCSFSNLGLESSKLFLSLKYSNIKDARVDRCDVIYESINDRSSIKNHDINQSSIKFDNVSTDTEIDISVKDSYVVAHTLTKNQISCIKDVSIEK